MQGAREFQMWIILTPPMYCRYGYVFSISEVFHIALTKIPGMRNK